MSGVRSQFRQLTALHVVGLVLTGLLLFFYVRHEREQIGTWTSASDQRAAAHATLEKIPRADRPQLTVLVLDLSTWQVPGVPVFYAGDDISSAAQYWLDEPTLHAWLVPLRSGVRCEATQVVATDNIGAERIATYPHAAIADVGQGRANVIRDQSSCRAALAKAQDAPAVSDPTGGDKAVPT